MYTSFGILALAGFLGVPVPSANRDVVWWRDYRVAQEKGVKEHKPLAVFVGSGQGGYHQLAREGRLNDTVRGVLAENYVCVFLDTKSPSQEGLIKALAISTGTGLILSDRNGDVQAFHHDGQLPEAELASQLQHFAVPDLEIRTTVSNANPRVSNYPDDSSNPNPAGRSNFRQSFYAPATSTRNC
jgi:hypothetical protein